LPHRQCRDAKKKIENGVGKSEKPGKFEEE